MTERRIFITTQPMAARWVRRLPSPGGGDQNTKKPEPLLVIGAGVA
jgi:hypothetical protein